MIATWLAGYGRYWDSPTAELLQRIGLGSVVYVFALAALLWLFIKPFASSEWGYRKLLTFIALLSPPALLYAIPVERIWDVATAATINVWFLAIVATWRVFLLVHYVMKVTGAGIRDSLIIAFLPMTLVITALTMLNLEKAAFNIMSGIQSESASDAAYLVLIILTGISVLVFLPLLLAWILILPQLGAFRGRTK